MKEFTLQNGLDIQAEQIRAWKPKLVPKLYNDLVAFASTDKENWSDGFDVRRGVTLSNFIANWKSFEIKKALHELYKRFDGLEFNGLIFRHDGHHDTVSLVYPNGESDIIIHCDVFESDSKLMVTFDVADIDRKFTTHIPTNEKGFDEFKKMYTRALFMIIPSVASVDKIVLDTNKKEYTLSGFLVPEQTISFTDYTDWDSIDGYGTSVALDCQIDFDEQFNFQYTDLNYEVHTDSFNLDDSPRCSLGGSCRNYRGVEVELVKDHGYDIAVNFGKEIGSQTIGWEATYEEAMKYINRINAKDVGLDVDGEWEGGLYDIVNVWLEPCEGVEEEPLHNLTTRLIDQFYIKYDSMSEYGDEETKRELDAIVKNYVK